MISTSALIAVLAAAALPQADSTRIYGVVTTDDGSRYAGYIRWDRNEASWTDVLHGSKRISEEHMRQAERLGADDPDRDDSWFVRLAEDLFDEEFSELGSSRESGIRFGHILTLERDGGHAELVLITGQQVELRSGGDVGGAVREIIVEDPRAGTVELDWHDIDRVEFLTPEAGSPEPASERLYGTLTTDDGRSFTGWVAWDMDEVLASDILDGEQDDADREIPFGRIQRIQRAGSEAARITLRGGHEIRLDDSNDVDDDNRDIVISDPGLGDVRVDWDAFREIRFHEPSSPVSLPALEGDGRIRGTVTTRDGRTLRGAIRWDNDEEYDWEFLDGEAGGVDLDIEFARIRSIESRGDDAARVTLLDGRAFTLEDSNDVDRGNDGIFVTSADGRTVHVAWRDFRRVDLDSSMAARP